MKRGVHLGGLVLTAVRYVTARTTARVTQCLASAPVHVAGRVMTAAPLARRATMDSDVSRSVRI